MGAANVNVQGRREVGALRFGQLWQKTQGAPEWGRGEPERVRCGSGRALPEFSPKQLLLPFHGRSRPWRGFVHKCSLGGMPVHTERVIYADDESFTVMTPEGHPESGWNTFSAYSDEEGAVAQVQSLARANDPIYELGFRWAPQSRSGSGRTSSSRLLRTLA